MAMASTNELFNTEVFGNRNFDALDAVDTTDARILPPGAPMVFVRDVVEIGCATLTAEPNGQSAMQLEVKLRGVLAAGRRPWRGTWTFGTRTPEVEGRETGRSGTTVATGRPFKPRRAFFLRGESPRSNLKARRSRIGRASC